MTDTTPLYHVSPLSSIPSRPRFSTAYQTQKLIRFPAQLLHTHAYYAPPAAVTDYSFGGQFNSYPSGQTPYGPTGFTGYASAPCRATDVLTFRFPAPTTVSQIMFFSRADNNVIVTRPVNNSYRVALVNEAGADVEVVSLAEASTVITRNFSTPYAAPALPPPPSDAVQIAQRTTWVRYIRVTSAGLQSLTFKVRAPIPPL